MMVSIMNRNARSAWGSSPPRLHFRVIPTILDVVQPFTAAVHLLDRCFPDNKKIRMGVSPATLTRGQDGE
jgi:hypothetical protein